MSKDKDRVIASEALDLLQDVIRAFGDLERDDLVENKSDLKYIHEYMTHSVSLEPIYNELREDFDKQS